MLRITFAAIAITAIVLSGAVHGLWTDRWTKSEEPTQAAVRLERIPLVLGDWEGHIEDLGDPARQGGVAGYFFARYVNRRDRSEVSVFLVCGRPGPVSIHTPDACYKASGFDVISPSRYSAPDIPSLAPAEFWTARMIKERSAERTSLRIYWAWNGNGSWVTPENPRLSFARLPVLYKLYLIRQDAGDSNAPDPCVELMRDLLPELNRTLFMENSNEA
jgi:hypothetical protein